MKQEDLIDAIGEVSDVYIRDARNAGRRIPGWITGTSFIAACLMLVWTFGIFMVSDFGAHGGSTEPETGKDR